MTAMNFPNTPVPGQIYAPSGGPVYRFDDPIWTAVQGVPPTDDISGMLVTATGGSTARTLADHTAKVLTPEDFGAVGDGVTDDSAAINAAFDYVVAQWGGGRVHLTSNYYVGSTITVPARCTLTGDNGSSIGTHVSALIGSAALSPVVRMYGGGAASTTAIERVAITRAGIVSGTPVADGTVGLLIESTDQCRVVDTYLRGHAYCVDVHANQTAFHFERVQTTHCHKAHYRYRAGAQITLMDCFLGHNGNSDVTCVSYVEIDNESGAGTVDTCSFVRVQFNQATALGKVNSLLYFKSYGLGTSNGMFKFTNCHAEGFDPATAVVVKADPGVTVIREFMADKTTTFLTSSTTLNFFDIPDTTIINLFVFDGGTTFSINCPNNTNSDYRIGGYLGRNISIPDGSRAVLTGMYCLGTLTIGPATVLRLAGGGFHVHGLTTISGVLSGQLHGNFNAGLTDTSTGTLEIIGSYVTAAPTIGAKLQAQFMQLKDARPFKVWDITGTTDASGNAVIAHGSGGTTNLRVRHVQAFYKNASGVAIPMTVNYIDGVNVSISNAAAVSRPFIISMILSSATHAGW